MNLIFFSFIWFLMFVNLVSSKELNKEFDCKCRLIPEKRIVNGVIAHHLAYPFLVSLSYNRLLRMTNNSLKKLLPDNLKMSGLICSATIINQNFLITSGSCISTSNMKNLTIGLKNKNDLIRMFDDEFVPIKQVFIHPKFNNLTGEQDFGYNLALIELEKSIDFSNFNNSISPACLRINSRNKNKIYSNLQSAGWGSIVNQINSNSPFNHRFLKQIDLIDKSNVTKECLENSKLMCTKSLNAKDLLALNDLGGSVVNTVNGRSYVVSILSHLEIEMNENTQTAHFTDKQFSSRIFDSIDWIREYVKEDFCSD